MTGIYKHKQMNYKSDAYISYIICDKIHTEYSVYKKFFYLLIDKNAKINQCNKNISPFVCKYNIWENNSFLFTQSLR